MKVSAPDLCGRFSGRVIRNVNTQGARRRSGWSTGWPRCGQRSVTALVDISNYVMFEFGRPSHIFDLDKIHGGLDVRWGQPGEQLKLLNGNTIEVDEKVGVIADDAQVESLAGIMGGDATAVSRRHEERLCRGRLLVAARRSRAARAASTSPPMPATASSAASTRADGRAHRAHHAADPGHLRRRGRPDGRPGR